ncbi:MBL fold metallo-hydrolase [Ideonella sp. BN130291]|uniref:MBL fold metallo-hydrolase n=1 Tax=Ideonella sp. BN130291 TaxID=3112940 RepID=UPI002E274335|nr:MBL fold metallo-hydrolase [Ideonella sp. BN130291]
MTVTPIDASAVGALFGRLGLRVFERGWLSSNNVLFAESPAAPATVVDTGYSAHAAQTVALIEKGLAEGPLARIVNTHLHSDHCGGNAALQRRWAVETLVPRACYEAVNTWDEQQLTFSATDQRCEPFVADGALSAGDALQLGAATWEVHAAPGHDPTALMLFEPASRVLISGDALWERRLAIIFPELVGEPGFGPCLDTLDAIEALDPVLVIPGHGRPFVDVAAALRASRGRLQAFIRDPAKHRRHAVRALVMFHMLEVGECRGSELVEWLAQTPIHGGMEISAATEVVEGLLEDWALKCADGVLRPA